MSNRQVGDTWEQVLQSQGIEIGVRWLVEAVDADGAITDRRPTEWMYTDVRADKTTRPSIITPDGPILLRAQDEGTWRNAPGAWRHRDWLAIGTD